MINFENSENGDLLRDLLRDLLHDFPPVIFSVICSVICLKVIPMQLQAIQMVPLLRFKFSVTVRELCIDHRYHCRSVTHCYSSKTVPSAGQTVVAQNPSKNFVTLENFVPRHTHSPAKHD